MIYSKYYKELVYPAILDEDPKVNNLDIPVSQNKNNPQRIYQNLLIVVHCILQARQNQKNRKSDTRDDIEFPLCTAILTINRRDYRIYLDFLIEIGFIYCTEDAITGHCALYQIQKKYIESHYKTYRLFRSNNIKDDKLFHALSRDKEDKGVVTQYSYLYKSFEQVSVDYNKAKLIINENLNKVQQASLLEELRRMEGLVEEERLATFKLGITGRLYTPFSNLKKELRSCILLDGKNMIELDLSNSLPFMGLGLVSSYSSCFLSLYEKEVFNNIGGKGGTPIMLSKKGTHVGDEDDYLNAVCDGSIYKNLQELWELDTKSKAKELFLKLCNSPVTFLEDNNHWRAFNDKFPSVANKIEFYNKDFHITKKMAKKYYWETEPSKCLYAIYTQKMEAYIILDYISNKLVEDDPSMPFLTLHDAFYLPDGNKHYREKIEDWIEELVGLRPIVKLKKCD